MPRKLKKRKDDFNRKLIDYSIKPIKKVPQEIAVSEKVSESVQSDRPPPSFPLELEQITLLRYIHNRGGRLNIRKYSKLSKKPRSTIYDYLKKLEKHELIQKTLGDAYITEKGKLALGASNKGVGSSRWGCRNNQNLSTHYHKFKLPISCGKKFNKLNLKELNPVEYYENNLHNLHQLIIKFEDATVIINPKKLIINLFDVVSDNVEDSDIQCLNRALEYAKKFRKIGIETEGIMVEEGHWARMESALSDFLAKNFDGQYFLDLGDGKKFWIDYSKGIEDETNDKEVRQKIDSTLSDIANNPSYLPSQVKQSIDSILILIKEITQSQANQAKLVEGFAETLKFLMPPVTKEENPSYLG